MTSGQALQLADDDVEPELEDLLRRLEVPGFGLTPLRPDKWRLDFWFAVPLRMWIGSRASDRVQGMGLSYVARRGPGAWALEDGDVLAEQSQTDPSYLAESNGTSLNRQILCPERPLASQYSRTRYRPS